MPYFVEEFDYLLSPPITPFKGRRSMSIHVCIAMDGLDVRDPRQTCLAIFEVDDAEVQGEGERQFISDHST